MERVIQILKLRFNVKNVFKFYGFKMSLAL